MAICLSEGLVTFESVGNSGTVDELDSSRQRGLLPQLACLDRTPIETQKMLKSSVNILLGSASHERDITGRRYRLQEASVIIHLSAKAHVSNG